MRNATASTVRLQIVLALLLALVLPALFASAAGAQCTLPATGEVWAAQLPLLHGSGDWTVARVGPAGQNLEIVGETDGLLTLGCNGGVLDPSQGVLAATILEYSDVLVESGDVGGDAVLGMARVGENLDDSAPIAAAYFPYAAGWTGGRFDGTGTLQESNPASGNPGAPSVTRLGVGDYEVTIPTVQNSFTDGMLYVVIDGTTENIASARATDPTDGSPGTGTWRVRSLDNQASVGLQDRGVRFVYLPYAAPGRIAGRISGAGSVVHQIGSWTVTKIGTGGYRLDLPSETPNSGMLLLGTGNSFANPDDNFFRYEDDGSGRFEVWNRDLDATNGANPQDSEFVFTFVPFPAQVLGEHKLGSTNTGGPFSDLTSSGAAIAALGDLDGDGVPDQVVGSRALGTDEGELYVLRMNSDGSVKGQTVIKSGTSGFAETLTAGDAFAESVAAIGDLDHDGVIDVAVGATGVSGSQGAVWVLFMNADGTVRAHQKIAAGEGGFPASLANGALFGSGLAGVGDVDGDRVPDLAVGAAGDIPSGGSSAQGTAWILLLNADGTVKGAQQIGEGIGGFSGNLGSGDEFGTSLAALGDVNGDAIPDLAVGTPGYSADGGALIDAGGVWILRLNVDGTVGSDSLISRIDSGFELFASLDGFGTSVTALGDLNGDGTQDLAIGADHAGESGVSTGPGQAFLTFLDASQSVIAVQRVGDRAGGFMGTSVLNGDEFGSALAALGDLDGDGVTDLSVGEVEDVGVMGSEGATWTLFLDGVQAMCGDAVLDPAERCDDGNQTGGDGCAATCTHEDVLGIQGTAQGGLLSVSVSGTIVSVATVSGQTPLTVSLTLANAISTDPTLAAALIYGIPQPGAGESSVITNGLFQGWVSTDPGLTFVPEPTLGSMLAAGALLLTGLHRRRERRGAM